MIRVTRRHYGSSELDASSGYYVCTAFTPVCTFTMINNIVNGFDQYGFMMSLGDCTGSNTITFGNKALSGDIGFLYTNNGKPNCITTNGTVARFTSNGVGFRSTADYNFLNDFESVENVVGVSIRTMRKNDHTYVYNTLSNSNFVGRTIYSYCGNCDTDLDCQQRIGYMFGVTDSGVVEITTTAKIELPLYGQAHESNMLGNQTLAGLQFMNFYFDTPQCTSVNRDYSMASNSAAPDYELPQVFSNVSYYNVDPDGLVYMFNPNTHWLNPADCVDWNCTGPLNSLAIDTDGSVIGAPGYILPNSPGVAKADICTLKSIMNAYFCIRNQSDPNYYMVLQFESFDSDNQTRTFSPINVTSYGNSFTSESGGGFRDDLANFQDHTWDGFYTGHIRWSRFPGIVWSGQYYNITARGTLPNSWLFQLQATGGNTQAVVVAIYYQDPAALNVYRWSDNSLISPLGYSGKSLIECSLTSSHGANQWYANDHIFQFVLRTEEPLYIAKSSSVTINMEMDMDINYFFANGGTSSFIDRFAAMLKIPSYRIRIANVAVGSVILDIIILPDNILSVSGTATTSAQNTELQQVLQTVNGKYTSGEMETALNIVLMNFSADVVIVVVNTQTSTGSGTGNNGNNNGGINDSNDNGGVIGIPIIDTPSGLNQGKSRTDSSSFSIAIEDWVIAICAGILFLLIVISGLIIYKQNAAKTISLHEISPNKMNTILNDPNFDGKGSSVWIDESSPVGKNLINRNEEKKESNFEIELK